MAGTYSELIYHLVFSTKNREPLISPQLREELYAYTGGIIRDLGGRLLEIGGIQEHVHLDGGDYGSGVEVSESAVSVPRRESPTTALRIAEPISVAPNSKVLSGGT
jgi:hypothetical protein